MGNKGLFTLGILLSNIAYAGAMGSMCNPGGVTVPCETKKWDFGVQAVYLKPVFDVDRSYIFNTFFGDLQRAFGTSDYINNYLDWDWGFHLEGSYHFGTGTDITADWTHYKSDSVTSINRRFDGGGAILIWDKPLNTVQNFEEVNVVLGQSADFGRIKNIRFYGGLQYSQMKDRVSVSRTVTDPAGNIQLINHYFDEVQFSGVGPVVGLDYQYEVGHGFSLVAKGQSSILSGRQRQTNYQVSTTLPTRSIIASKQGIVPSLETKFGVNYAYVMNSGTLNLQAGYQALNYFNALQNYQAVITPAIGPASTDFGLYGPYFGAKWIGNV